jgi:hypothetical protein
MDDQSRRTGAYGASSPWPRQIAEGLNLDSGLFAPERTITLWKTLLHQYLARHAQTICFGECEKELWQIETRSYFP